MTLLVGLSGKAGAGKDSLARFLVQDHGFVRIALADPVREALYRLDPLIGEGSTCLTDAVDSFGWDRIKRNPEVRGLMQRMGTEVGREMFGAEFWTDLAVERIAYALHHRRNVVVTDVRFVDEAERLRNIGGQIVRIERPDLEPVNDHPSETDLDEYLADYRLVNRAYAELPRKAAELVEDLQEGK